VYCRMRVSGLGIRVEVVRFWGLGFRVGGSWFSGQSRKGGLIYPVSTVEG
jgi:hypothetical protein